MAEAKPSLSVKSREIILITAIAIIAASLVFFVWPGVGQKQVRVPQELILGQIVDSSNVKLNFPDLSKVDVARFETEESVESLIIFYKKWLADHSFSIIREPNSPEHHLVVAEDESRYVNIAIFSDRERKLVSVVFSVK